MLDQHYYQEVLCLRKQVHHQKCPNKSGTTPSWFTMTMYQLTLVRQRSNFWPLWTVTSHPSFLTWFGPLWFLLIFENETANITTQNYNKTVPGMLNPLHKLGDGLLWRWQQWTITSVKEFFVTDSLGTYEYTLVQWIGYPHSLTDLKRTPKYIWPSTDTKYL